jgi:hypothetical protein
MSTALHLKILFCMMMEFVKCQITNTPKKITKLASVLHIS